MALSRLRWKLAPSHAGDKSRGRTPRQRSGYPRQNRKLLALRLERLEDRVVLDAGGLDLSFDTDGKVITDVIAGEHDTAADVVAYGPDGKLVAVGHTGGDFVVLRYNADGSLDADFGTDGKQRIDFGSDGDLGRGVAVDSKGRIVVAGVSTQSETGKDFAVARLTSDGQLDASFGIGGKQTIDFDNRYDTGGDVAVDSQDRVIVAGVSYLTKFIGDFAVARLTTAGVLDTDFATDGKQIIDFGGSDIAGGVAVDSLDRVVVAGYSAQSGSGTDFAVVRLTGSGELDSEFGSAGIQTVDFSNANDFAGDVAIDSHDRVVLGGFSRPGESEADFAVARLTSAGVLDTSFASDGLQTVDLGTPFDYGLDLAIDSHGRLIMAGHIVDSSAGIPADFAFLRLTSGGELDSSFASDGTQTVDLGGGVSDWLQGVAVDSQDRIIGLGFSDQNEASGQPDTRQDFALVRLMPGDPPVDGTLEVLIDIKPKSASNPINPRSRGFTKVAILSNASFDAVSQVDLETLTFGRTGEETSLALHKKDAAPRASVEDADGDGLLDLVVSFMTEETGFQPGDSLGVLRGETFTGQAFEGQDVVRIHGKQQPLRGEGESAPAANQSTLDGAWTNWAEPMDINDDGRITPLDALLGINALNRGSFGDLPLLADDAEINVSFVDTNGDGKLSPLDALLVINHLNRDSQSAASRTDWTDQADSAHSSPDASLASLVLHDELVRRRRS